MRLLLLKHCHLDRMLLFQSHNLCCQLSLPNDPMHHTHSSFSSNLNPNLHVVQLALLFECQHCYTDILWCSSHYWTYHHSMLPVSASPVHCTDFQLHYTLLYPNPAFEQFALPALHCHSCHTDFPLQSSWQIHSI